MNVETTAMLRSTGSGQMDDPFRPNSDILGWLRTFGAYSVTDITGKPADQQHVEPRHVCVQIDCNPDHLSAMIAQGIWILRTITRNNDGEIVSDDGDEAYSANERTLRVGQLIESGFVEAATVALLWPIEATRLIVMQRLIAALRAEFDARLLSENRLPLPQKYFEVSGNEQSRTEFGRTD